MGNQINENCGHIDIKKPFTSKKESKENSKKDVVIESNSWCFEFAKDNGCKDAK